MMVLVDSHCHLDLIQDRGQNLDDVISRSSENGVKYIQTICTKLSNFSRIIEIANKYDNVFASVGVHPNGIDAVSEIVTNKTLEELSSHSRVIGFGETGLDYYHPNFNKQAQIRSFQSHIVAASNIRLPIIIHTRAAAQDTIDIIKSEMRNKEFSAVIHCFTEDQAFAHQILDLGLYISMSGVVTFKNAPKVKEALQIIPLDRLLIETDAPYLAPAPMRGKANEPEFMKRTAEFIADFLNISIHEVAKHTTSNFFNLFKKAKQLCHNYDEF